MSNDTPKKSSKRSARPVMDVSKPGKTAPSASSRPIIIGHKTVQDSTVTEQSATDEVETEPKVTRSGPRILMPISDDLKAATVDADEDAAEVVPEDSDQSEATLGQESSSKKDDSITEEAEAEDEDPPTKPSEEGAEAVSSTSDSDSAAVDAVAEQADTKKKEARALEEAKKRQQEFNKIIDSKKYNVPIGERTRRRRQGKGLIALLVLLLLLAGSYVAADRFTDLPLPYEFFKTINIPEEEQQANTPKAAEADNTKESVLKETFVGEEVISGDKSYSIKIPNGWSVELDNNGNSLKAAEPKDVTYSADTKPTITWVDGWGTDSPMRFSIYYSTAAEDAAIAEEGEAVTPFVTDDGLQGGRYYKQHPLEEIDGPGYFPGEKTYIYRFEKSGVGVSIVYRLLEKNNFSPADQLTESDPDQLELIEQVVKTFKLL